MSPELLVGFHNKAVAPLQLTGQSVSVKVGGSTSAESSENYFIKLMRLVVEERRHYTVYQSPHDVFLWTQMGDTRE